MASISVTSTSESSIGVSVTGISSSITTVNFYYRKSGDSSNTYDTSVGSSYFGGSGNNRYCSNVFSGLEPGTTYVLLAATYINGTRQELISTSGTTDASSAIRPSNWTGFGSVSKGAKVTTTKIADGEYEAAYLSASEWNSFWDRIGEFLEYKGFTVTGSWSRVSSGDPMLASQVNDARDAINLMSPPIAVPSAISSGDKITAAFIVGLKNSLNSIE